MSLKSALISLFAGLIVLGCGGNDPSTGSPASSKLAVRSAVSTGAVSGATAVTNNVALFPGNSANYNITLVAGSVDSFAITDNVGSNGTRNISINTRLRFDDTSIALDVDGNAGKVYRLYKAAFNRTPDLGGLGFWISAMDSGAATLSDIAAGFIISPEYQKAYLASTTNSAVVTLYYQNILGRPADPGGFKFWVDVLNSDPSQAANVLAAISESPENKSLVLPTIAGGIAFTLRTPQVTMKTSMGDMVIELYPQNAPITVSNFLAYVNDSTKPYANTIFHRVVSLSSSGISVIQGGGFTSNYLPIPQRAAIQLEVPNGLTNLRGTIAMARLATPLNSATSQFFINTHDNPALDDVQNQNAYAVFGKVITGMDVADQIQATPVVNGSVGTTSFLSTPFPVKILVSSITQTQ